MDDVMKKTIKTIETLETIKHNETVDLKEIVHEQSFYLSSLSGNSSQQEQMLKSLNEDGSKHALGISVDDAEEEKALANDLLHVNESSPVHEEPLAQEVGQIHSAHFYLALLHKNDSTGPSWHNKSIASLPQSESVKLAAGRMKYAGHEPRGWPGQGTLKPTGSG